MSGVAKCGNVGVRVSVVYTSESTMFSFPFRHEVVPSTVDVSRPTLIVCSIDNSSIVVKIRQTPRKYLTHEPWLGWQ